MNVGTSLVALKECFSTLERCNFDIMHSMEPRVGIKNTQEEHTLRRTHLKKNTPQEKHTPRRTHPKKNTHQEEHTPRKTHIRRRSKKNIDKIMCLIEFIIFC